MKLSDDLSQIWSAEIGELTTDSIGIGMVLLGRIELGRALQGASCFIYSAKHLIRVTKPAERPRLLVGIGQVLGTG